MINYRSSSLNDIDELLEIENESFVNPWKKEDLIYELTSNPLNKFLVIEIDGKIIGFIDYMITFNSATISQIAIKKEYRNKGYATNLLNKMEETFIKSGEDAVEYVTLEVRNSNINAQKLYEKNGYKKVTIKKNYYLDGEDAIYMVKGLI